MLRRAFKNGREAISPACPNTNEVTLKKRSVATMEEIMMVYDL